MNNFETVFVDLMPKELGEDLYKGTIPSIYHCVGTDKLLGQFYGLAICKGCGIKDEQTITILTNLSMLFRAYIVLDDFVKDKAISGKRKDLIAQWLLNIEKNILLLSGYLEPKRGEKLWSEFLDKYNNAYYNFNKKNIFSSIIDKCALIFIPFEFDLLKNCDKATSVKHIMEYYLFSLQLIDDFQDIEEDQKATKNHNLFLLNVSESNYKKVSNLKSQFLNPLLDFIKRNIEKLDFSENDVILRFFLSSLNWIEEKRIQDTICNIEFTQNFNTFDFNDSMVNKLEDNQPNYAYCLDCIRAENMHTLN